MSWRVKLPQINVRNTRFVVLTDFLTECKFLTVLRRFTWENYFQKYGSERGNNNVGSDKREMYILRE